MGSFDKKNGRVSCNKTLKDRFSKLYAMKYFLGIDETHTAVEWSFKAATKLKRDLPTKREKCTTYGSFVFSWRYSC